MQDPTIRDTHPLLDVNLYNDPTPDGVYGYRISLPVGPIAGINISFAEVRATTAGLSLTRKKRTVFWFTRPTCPHPVGRRHLARDEAEREPAAPDLVGFYG